MPADELTQPAGPHVDPLTMLAGGTVEILGRMPWSSNATFLVTVRDGADDARAVYKPARGERPLWDFPSGLYRREVAAYRLSEFLGVGLVPPTVVRENAPFGPGSLQWFVSADFAEHYFSLHQQRPDLHDRFRDLAVFDVVANNTDRKSGHCLIDAEERVWAIDNGLCFAAEFKLRTVIWEFGGEPLPGGAAEALDRLVAEVPTGLRELLAPEEVVAMQERAATLRQAGVLPVDTTGRRYPWPLV